MLLPDALRPLQIGDGARHLEDSGVIPGREAELLRHHLQQPVLAGIRLAELSDLMRPHVGVAVDLGSLEALKLNIPRRLDTLRNRRRAFPFFRSASSQYFTAGTSMLDDRLGCS